MLIENLTRNAIHLFQNGLPSRPRRNRITPSVRFLDETIGWASRSGLPLHRDPGSQTSRHKALRSSIAVDGHQREEQGRVSDPDAATQNSTNLQGSSLAIYGLHISNR